MAAALQSIVAGTFTDTGTGPFTVSAYGGRQTLATAFGTTDPGAGNRPYLFIWNQDATSEEWAVVTGHMTSATSLTIDSTVFSSNGGSTVTWTAGTKYVSNDIPHNFQLSLETTRTANTVLAGPTGGGAAAPTFRALVAADIPNLDASKITTGTMATARLGSGTANSGTWLRGDQSWQALPAASDTAAGIQENADQTEMEAASSTTRNVTPGRQHFHPGHPKFDVLIDGTGTPSFKQNYGGSSIGDNATGDWTLNLAITFSSANWNVSVNSGAPSGGSSLIAVTDRSAAGAQVTRTATTIRITSYTAFAGVATDSPNYSVQGWGDL